MLPFQFLILLVLYPVSTDEEPWYRQGVKYPYSCDIAISPNGRYVAWHAPSHTVLWDLKDGTFRRMNMQGVSFEGRTSDLKQIALSNHYLAVLGTPMKVFRLEDDTTISLDTTATAAAFSPDNQLVTATGAQVHVWELEHGEKVMSLRGGLGEAVALSFSQEGILFGSFEAYDRGYLGVWDWGSKQMLYRHRFGKIFGFWCSPNGPLVQTNQGLLRLDLETQELSMVFLGMVTTVSPEGTKLVFSEVHGEYGRKWWYSYHTMPINKPYLVKELNGPKGMNIFQIFPDDKHVLASWGNKILVYDHQGEMIVALHARSNDCWYVKTSESFDAPEACRKNIDPPLAFRPNLLKSLHLAP